MRNVLMLFLVISCAHQKSVEAPPHWVSALRTGETQLKVQNGSKTFYRRIAGGPELSRQTSCELVIHKAEEDIRKEFPNRTDIPYTVEVLYYDEMKKDCAVTVSLENKQEETADVTSDELLIDKLIALKEKDKLSDLDVAEMLNLRSEIAKRYALTGLQLDEFEKYTNEKVALINADGPCLKSFRLKEFSIHGNVEVCWQNNHVRGYCTPRTGQCWVRTAQ